MKQLVVAVMCVLVTVVCASPKREKRSAMALAGAGFPFGGVGAFAGGGFGWPIYPSPYDYPRAFMPMTPISWPVFTFPKPWYEGDNVCTTTKEIQDPKELQEWFSEASGSNVDYSHESEQCQGSGTKYVCFKRYMSNGESKMQVTKYECCHGFVRSPAGAGCVESNPVETTSNGRQQEYYYYFPQQPVSSSTSSSRFDMKDLLPTLRDMGALKMISVVKEVGMKNALYTGNFTIFCPLNSALEMYLEDYEFHKDNEIIGNYHFGNLEKKKKLREMIKRHMVSGFLKVDDFRDKQKLETRNKNTQTRVNIYYIPEKVVTVNCVPIITADYFARNGVIHLVDKVLPEPSRTVADIIAGDAQFSVLKGMLSRAGLVQTLRNPNKTFTVFAPADSSFTKPWLEKEEENDRCITNLMKHHIIDHVICSQAIPHFAKSLNMIGELLSLSRDEHNKLYVDDIQVVVKDLVATNGVVHIIDGLLSTRQAKTVTQVLEKYGLSEFLSLIEMANLGSYFDSMDNVTFFIPSDDSLKTISPSHLESFMYDAEALREVLLYHVGIGQTEINAPDQVLDSRLPNTSIRIQVHSAYPYATPQILVQCATILSPGNKICGGTLHVINKVLLPPKLSLIQLLENIDGFSTLVLLLRVTGLERRLRDTSVRYTLLAPTDDAFHQMGQGPLFRLLEDLSLAADLVKMHIISGTVCCSQLKADLMIGRGQVRAIDGSSLRMERTREGTLTVADAMIVDCDIMATNGAIHMVDSVLLQKSGNGVYIRI